MFGSTVKGDSDESSNVGLVVEFDRPIGFQFVEFAEYLEGILGRRVDLLTPAGVRTIRSRRVAESILASVTYV